MSCLLIDTRDRKPLFIVDSPIGISYWLLHLYCIPLHGDFLWLKATWRPASRHLRECVVACDR